jgi:hypothetical protein
MKAHLMLKLAASFCLGGLVAWALPPSWFPCMFLILIGVTTLLGIATGLDAKEEKAPHPVVEVLSILFLWISNPNAVVERSIIFLLFLCSAAATLGMGLAIIVLANT